MLRQKYKNFFKIRMSVLWKDKYDNLCSTYQACVMNGMFFMLALASNYIHSQIRGGTQSCENVYEQPALININFVSFYSL